jgi:hypothetical protein
MKKYLLGLALVAAMVFGTSTVVAGTPVKKVAKTEQTASVKKANAKKTVAAKKVTKKAAKSSKKAPVAKKTYCKKSC